MLAIVRKSARRLAIAALGTALLVGGYCGYLQLSGNLHTVIAGEVYRSGQPDAERIADYAKRYGIKSIINLRGANDHKDWYREEVAAARQLGLTHIDFRMSAKRELPVERMQELIALMRAAPKPLLIHCASGADRTGLAAVAYLSQIAHQDEETAERQLSLYFGHFSIPYLSTAFAMDKSWETMERYLRTGTLALNDTQAAALRYD